MRRQPSVVCHEEGKLAGALRIGTSGWQYRHWRERFYPLELPAREQLSFYADEFDTVELNNSFYRQPSREQFERWAEQVPAGFIFAAKGSRYVSHVKRLAVGQSSVDMVVEAARGLREKLGPILFQFPGNWQCDLERLEGFLRMLPDHVRFTFEFRHDSWLVPPVFDLLRSHRAALCIPDHPNMPQALEVTADFTYVRMHAGARGIGYGRAALEKCAKRLCDWSRRGTDCYVYFNNDAEGYAIRNARTLKELLADGADG